MRRPGISLAVATGLLLGVSFPPFQAGAVAFVAFLPFFILFESVDGFGEAARLSYVMLFTFNAVALYWTGGFTHHKDYYLMTAGAMLLIAHPFFFALPLLAWVGLRRMYGYLASLAAFPLLWVANEFLHSKSELSFPWLTLGNTQTYDLPAVQFASVTGVYGISLWVLVINVLIYILVRKLLSGEWKISSPRSITLASLVLIIYAAPKAYGTRLLSGDLAARGPEVRIAAVQPDIDPFEKWGGAPGGELGLYQGLTDSAAKGGAELVIWPETALPLYLLHPANAAMLSQIKRQADTLGISLLTGTPDIVYYPDSASAPAGSKLSVGGKLYETFNSSILLTPGDTLIQKYAKNLLVPFAERVPYSTELSFLNAMKWNFGLGGWNIGRDTGALVLRVHLPSGIKFANMICYESIYPSFVADFVRRGAGFLTVITNDSWWGNTSGAYQHKQIGILRAVENRRWLVQCANGGISCIVDPFGRTLGSTPMFVRTVLSGTIEERSDLTFYTLHGDWFAEICLVISLFLVATMAGKKTYMYIRRTHEAAHEPAHEPD
jgi:apolipoprotein N-acyltransferase